MSGSTGSADPQAATPRDEGNASYRRQSRTARGVRRGAPGEGERGGTLAAAEHACSTPRSKWSAECEKNALSTDAPEGVVGENKEEVRVQPFSCTGCHKRQNTQRKGENGRGI